MLSGAPPSSVPRRRSSGASRRSPRRPRPPVAHAKRGFSGLSISSRARSCSAASPISRRPPAPAAKGVSAGCGGWRGSRGRSRRSGSWHSSATSSNGAEPNRSRVTQNPLRTSLHRGTGICQRKLRRPGARASGSETRLCSGSRRSKSSSDRPIPEPRFPSLFGRHAAARFFCAPQPLPARDSAIIIIRTISSTESVLSFCMMRAR